MWSLWRSSCRWTWPPGSPMRRSSGEGAARAGADAPGLYQLLGRTHEARREAGPAESAYRKAIELDPVRSGAYGDLARLYAQQGPVDDALTTLAEGLKVSPKDSDLLLVAGTLHERKGNIPEAEEAYEKALAVNPRHAMAANNLAYLLSEHGGDADRALELARTAKQAAPADPTSPTPSGGSSTARLVYGGPPAAPPRVRPHCASPWSSTISGWPRSRPATRAPPAKR